MGNWYVSREAVKLAANINGADQDSRLDRIIEDVSLMIRRATRVRFIPITQTRVYRWPRRSVGQGRTTELWVDEWLLSVSELLTRAQDSTPTTISSSDFFLEDVNEGPPFLRIEMDLSSSAAFEGGA